MERTRRAVLVAAVAWVFVLGVTLVGCGGNTEDNKANFVGEWTLSEMADGSETIKGDDLAKWGLTVTLTNKEDGTSMGFVKADASGSSSRGGSGA